jgi:hypothetical protein
MAERETRAHTPGPWVYEEKCKSGRYRVRALEGGAPIVEDSYLPRLEDAALIASAPALAARVEELEGLLNRIAYSDPRKYDAEDFREFARAALSHGAK